ncbi:MAG: cytochrome bc1 complex diheme cytochrome c subunit [Acidimicrobiales bacterium]
MLLLSAVGIFGLVAFMPTAAHAGSNPPASLSSTSSSHPFTPPSNPVYQFPGPGGYYPATNPPPANTSSHGITYTSLPKSFVAPGQALFDASCASCHGSQASGSSRAPNLQGLGAGTVDFWVSTGRMPLAQSSVQAVEKPPRFTPLQTLEIAAYVQSKTPGFGVAVPRVNLKNANLELGLSFYTLNCAACHTITGAGDALAGGSYAPSLHLATAAQVVEAIRSGPGNMPHFSQGNITNAEARNIAAYVTEVIQHPVNRGGVGLGGIGPVGEGFVALLIGVGGLMLVSFWIGERS